MPGRDERRHGSRAGRAIRERLAALGAFWNDPETAWLSKRVPLTPRQSF